MTRPWDMHPAELIGREVVPGDSSQLAIHRAAASSPMSQVTLGRSHPLDAISAQGAISKVADGDTTVPFQVGFPSSLLWYSFL